MRYAYFSILAPDLVIPHEPREMDRLCPDVYVTYHTHPLSSPSPSAPASQNTQPPCPSNTVPASAQQDIACARDEMKRSLHRHSKSLMVLTILLGVVLLGFVVLLLGKAVARWGQRRPKHQKYKSVSNYFPFSYKQDVTHVVIPELGMPKGGGAERQVLLDASDEDEFWRNAVSQCICRKYKYVQYSGIIIYSMKRTCYIQGHINYYKSFVNII